MNYWSVWLSFLVGSWFGAFSGTSTSSAGISMLTVATTLTVIYLIVMGLITTFS